MADTETDKAAGDEVAAAPKKKIELLVMAMAAQAVLVLAAAGVITKFVVFSKRPQISKKQLVERAIASVRDEESKVKTVDLQEFIVNLPDHRTIKAHVKIEVSNESIESALAKRLPAIRARVLDVLSSTDSKGAEAFSGKLVLKDNIKSALNAELLKGKIGADIGVVREVYFVELFII